MHRGLLILFLSLVNNARTKFVEINVPLTSNSQTNVAQKQTIYGDDVVDNFRRKREHHHHHYKKEDTPGMHHSLHSVESHNGFMKSIKDMDEIPDIEDALPPAVVAAEKEYYKNPSRGFRMPKSWRRQQDFRSSLKKAQDGLSSQEKNHPGISLIYLPENPLLGSAKFPKRKPDDHSVYGNLQTLGLISLGNQFKEARAKKRPRARPPDAARQPHLLFDPNHPGMTLVHPKEQLILGFAKFAKPSESSHRVYGNDYSIGLRYRDKSQPLRFQYSGFRRNSDNKQMNRSDNPLNNNTKSKFKPPGLNLPFLVGRRLLRGRNRRRMNDGFSRTRYDNPRDNQYNPLDDISYKSLILRSGESNDDEAPWRIPVMIPIKLPTRQQQKEHRKLRLRKQEERKKNIKPGWVAVLRNSENSVNHYKKKSKQLLRNQQTIPPWVKIIEKDSKELEKLKPTIPPEKLVYGHFDNLGIRYGNQPYRVKYSNFRKNKRSKDKKQNLKAGNKVGLRNRQTMPPWIVVIEKTSQEIEQLKPKIPSEKPIYGNFDNLGIRYGNQPYRVKYSDFRKSQDHHASSDNFEIQKQPRPLFIRSGSNSTSDDPATLTLDPVLQKGILPETFGSRGAELVDWNPTTTSGPIPTNSPFGHGPTMPRAIAQFAPLIYNSASPIYWRRFKGDPVLVALLDRKIKNGKLSSYARQLHLGNQNEIEYRKFTENAQSYDTNTIVDAVKKAMRASYNKNQQLHKRRFGPMNSILNSPDSENNFDIENNAKEIHSGSKEDHNTNYRRNKRKDRSGSYERRNCSDYEKSSSSSSSSSGERNPGNPYTIFRDKYKQNWLWNHVMDGDHMNVNPYGPQFDPLGPSGSELFFGRKWWYFNQDDYRPFRRR